MDWWSTKSAVRVSLVSSSTLLAFCLLAVLYTMSEIASFQQQTDDDLKEWKHYADEAWRQMTQLSLRRPRSAARRFAKRQNEYSRSEYEPPQPAYYGGRDYYATPRHDQCNCAQQAQGCPAGLPGVPGLRGTDGEPGIPGQDGAPGANGVALNAYEQAQPGCIVCPPGPPGQQGKPGKLGDQGAPGLPGLPGYTPPPARPGPSGLCGDRGKPGQPGSPGRPGERGRDATCAIGLPGPKGVPGLTGPPGPPGNTGYTPPPGLPGPNGVGGPKGNDGLPGKPGLTGYPGPRGIPGQDAEYCPCPAKNRPKPYNSYVTAESAAYDTGHSSYVETSGYTAAKEEKEGEYRRRLLARVLKKQRRLVLTNRARNVRRKAVNPKLNTTPN